MDGRGDKGIGKRREPFSKKGVDKVGVLEGGGRVRWENEKKGMKMKMKMENNTVTFFKSTFESASTNSFMIAFNSFPTCNFTNTTNKSK